MRITLRISQTNGPPRTKTLESNHVPRVGEWVQRTPDGFYDRVSNVYWSSDLQSVVVCLDGALAEHDTPEGWE